MKAANEPLGDATRNNLIKRTIDEIYDLMAGVHDHREELLARGVTFHMLNALIELGVHDKPDEQAKMVQTAVEAAAVAQGSKAIKRDDLETRLEELVELEKDLRHVRHIAMQQGIHMQALNHLTQLMRLNPGDRGVTAVNTFVSYADAAGVDLSRVQGLIGGIKEESSSVLPDIDRASLYADRAAWYSLARNIAIGLLLSVLMFWVVL